MEVRPTGQFVQNDALAPAIVPAVQGTQPEAEDAAAMAPAGQDTHVDEPLVLLNVPGKHTRHAALPVPEA
jgi:hypothetical protein